MECEMYRIVIGADHRGFELKNELIKHQQIGAHAITWQDIGTFSAERTDYPPFAKKVAAVILAGDADLGLLSCGSGIGIAIAANRYKGIYAGVVWNEPVARMAKEDDNVNVLVLPADFISIDDGYKLVKAWLSSSFKEGRYQERLSQIDNQ
jgi:ribose 5-phosphate isomerase B